ncbi:guanine nucleotide-binding protein g(o) subunit alpha [Anaeramoeba flamelloides]|uniref:Guanine nucleotide-binding protein g(O) subunit alpha n=1 Tax=Anaeramoeba flamelloides TaxID=1746091 RepID=A0ABQ8YXX6_9EUKA|nr:guanine nucleotide-binding protein g(o) subunit alpha [Anaeramoeba flamelloides]
MGSKNSKKKRRKKKEQKRQNKIQNQLKNEKSNLDKELRLLILGTGDSGKSTFVKQMQVLFKNGFSKVEIQLYRDTIRRNLVSHTLKLVKAVEDFNLNLSRENTKLAQDFLSIEDEESKLELTEKKKGQIIQLWSDKAMKQVFERRSEFQIPDSAASFLDQAEEISSSDYVPTKDHILGCRIPTTGVKEVTFSSDDFTWRIIDVGGQRSERRKWIHHFENISILIYVVALSEYNLKLFEEQNINRMIESLKLFKQIVTNEYFVQKDCMLLFNKMDLFEEKLKTIDLEVCFSNYTGSNDVDEAVEFISEKFLDSVENKYRNIHIFRSTGTDTNRIQKIFEEIKSSVLEGIQNDLD